MRSVNKLLFFLLVFTNLSCKVRRKDFSPDEPVPSSVPTEARSVVSNDLRLVDYSFKEEDGSPVKGDTYLLHIIDPENLEEETKTLLHYNIFSEKYKINPSLTSLSNDFNLILADIAPSGRFFDIKERTFLNKSGDSIQCYSAAFENYSQLFFLTDDERKIEPFFGLSDVENEIAVSGKLCVESGGKLVSFENDGFFAIPKNGLVNLISILQTKGVKIQEGLQLGITGNPFPWLFRKITGAGKKGDFERIEGDSSPSRSMKHVSSKQTSSIALQSDSVRGSVVNASFRNGSNADFIPVRLVTQRLNPLPSTPRTPDLALVNEINFYFTRGPEGDLQGIYDINPAYGNPHWGYLPSRLPFEITPGTLGEGAFGFVKKVEVTRRDNTKLGLAVKVFKTEEAFQQGWRALTEIDKLGNHPNFLRQYGVMTDAGGRKAIVTELGGKDVHKIFVTERTESISEERMAHALHDVLDGIGHIHSSGMAHYDVKPANMLVGTDGRIKIIDLDDVAPPPIGITKVPPKPSSPIYCAPERIPSDEFQNAYNFGGDFDWRQSDVYSVGVSMLEMRTGMSFDKIFEEVMGHSFVDARTNSELLLGIFHQKLKESRFNDPSKPEYGVIISALTANPLRRPRILDLKAELNAVKPRPQ